MIGQVQLNIFVKLTTDNTEWNLSHNITMRLPINGLDLKANTDLGTIQKFNNLIFTIFYHLISYLLCYFEILALRIFNTSWTNSQKTINKVRIRILDAGFLPRAARSSRYFTPPCFMHESLDNEQEPEWKKKQPTKKERMRGDGRILQVGRNQHSEPRRLTEWEKFF